MTGGMQDVFLEQVPNIQVSVETVPIIDKVEKIVEVHQLQFSYQVVDVQLSRNEEGPKFRSEAHDRCL